MPSWMYSEYLFIFAVMFMPSRLVTAVTATKKTTHIHPGTEGTMVVIALAESTHSSAGNNR